MAEIKIEKKKSILPWIIMGLLLLAALLYFLFFRNDDDKVERVDDTTIVTDTDSVNARQNPSAVADYISFINADTASMGLNHIFTHDALVKLIDATDATANNQNFDIKADLDQARENAEKITSDPMDTQHANFIKSATAKITNALQNLQAAKFPDLASSSKSVQDASAAINNADLTLDQKQTVKNYFKEAGSLLQQMN
jgi:hypothetical protein